MSESVDVFDETINTLLPKSVPVVAEKTSAADRAGIFMGFLEPCDGAKTYTFVHNPPPHGAFREVRITAFSAQPGAKRMVLPTAQIVLEESLGSPIVLEPPEISTSSLCGARSSDSACGQELSSD